mgnify:CR=1 FL=1
MSVETIVWLAVLLGAILTEICTLDLVAIWFIPAALISLILSLFHVGLAWQIIVFVAVSVGLLAATRPMVKKFFAQKTERKTNIDAVIGSTGIVTETIDNLKNQGLVRVKSQIWTARNVTDEIIEEGSTVSVLRIEGVKIICEVNKEKGENE